MSERSGWAVACASDSICGVGMTKQAGAYGRSTVHSNSEAELNLRAACTVYSVCSGIFLTDETTPDSEHLTVYCRCLKLLLKDKKVLELSSDVYFIYFGRNVSFCSTIFQTKTKTGIFTEDVPEPPVYKPVLFRVPLNPERSPPRTAPRNISRDTQHMFLYMAVPHSIT